MGVGKIMQTIGLSDIYNLDYRVVVESLAKRLEYNIDIDFYDGSQFNLTIPEPQLLDFGYSRRCKLYVQYYDIDYEKPDINNIYCNYQLYIPNAQPNNENIEINFYPNNIIHVVFLDFESLWRTFFDTIFGDCCGQDLKKKFSEYHTLRHVYWDILTKLGCNEILIFTDFYYKLEELFDENTKKISSFHEILEYAKKMEDLFPINLVAAMNISSKKYFPWNPPEFQTRDCYAYVFVDEADAEQKELSLEWKGEGY